MSDTMRGDQALAWGALAAGVRVVTGYPGSPATGVFDDLLARTEPGEIDIDWAPNEKVAMEVGIGASIGGARALVVLKSVGLNVGLDPLATMSYTGCHRALVILVGDDPGAWGSQNEQDTRWAARLAEVPVVEPTNVRQAAALMTQAFAWSEAVGTPLILRVTRALALATGEPEEPWRLPEAARTFYRLRNRWISLPYLAVRARHGLHTRLRRIQALWEQSPYDVPEGGGDHGVVAVGYTRSKLERLLPQATDRVAVLGLASSWPLPEQRLTEWLRGRRRVLVLEEGSPFVEEGLAALAQHHNLDVQLLGRATRTVPEEGELGEERLAGALAELGAELATRAGGQAERAMPSETPLCEGCPYRPTFEALVEAMERAGGRRRHIVVGETSCMVRANLPPMELFDVKYSLGSGLGLGLGVAAAHSHHKVVSILGDSSFFHSDVNALPYAVGRKVPIMAILLDNGSAALTGGQTHPGSRYDERGHPRAATDPATLARGCGAEPTILSAHEPQAMADAFCEALRADGFRLLIVRGDCPIHTPRPGK